MKIRKAEIEDALGIAEVNIEVWRTTYKGLDIGAYGWDINSVTVSGGKE